MGSDRSVMLLHDDAGSESIQQMEAQPIFKLYSTTFLNSKNMQKMIDFQNFSNFFGAPQDNEAGIL